jgi:histone H3/H4
MGYVVVSAVKEAIKKHEMQCASDFADALEKRVESLIADAATRAKSNDRKTVRAGDL